MIHRKLSKKYIFSVEGETELWYLDWLQKIINANGSRKFNASIDCVVQKDPLKRAKSINNINSIEIWHISDYESNDDGHQKEFIKTIDRMKEANKLNKQIQYKFGYSNFSFDLWIILHMSDCKQSFAHRHQYINVINRLYNENFENMDEYKHEKNFKRCLKNLSIQNVVDAINRAKEIMNKNKQIGYNLIQYKGYYYYEENPSLSIWEIIEKILIECGIISKMDRV